jgi:hypothetical protein
MIDLQACYDMQPMFPHATMVEGINVCDELSRQLANGK